MKWAFCCCCVIDEGVTQQTRIGFDDNRNEVGVQATVKCCSKLLQRREHKDNECGSISPPPSIFLGSLEVLKWVDEVIA